VTAPSPPTSTLARLGFERPELAAASLTRLGAWPVEEPGGDELLTGLAASASPDLAARVLADLAAAADDPAGLRAALRERAGFRRRLIALTAASRSIGNWLVANPGEALRLADDARPDASRPAAELRADALAAVGAGARSPAADPDRCWRALRRFKRREFVRIAARDLVGAEASIEQVGAALAALAEACLEAALALALRPYGDRPPVRLALLGMGKLGGEELNYVSDVDVLACHEPADGVAPDEAAAAAGRIVRAIIRGLASSTTEGVCYRVDLNLRPEGRDGPLSRTLGSYLAYWNRWAEPWEFQALLKARPVAGDADLAARLCAEAEARVYPDRLSAGMIAEIRKMKARVEASIADRLVADRHVKHGPGGIRDIEWAVQLLQLVHGRQDPALRAGPTLAALDALAESGLVGRDDAGRLADAYRFLRTVEHRLQLADERRTHVLPERPAELGRLARVLGFRDGPSGSALAAFEAARRQHAVTVRTLHEKLFYRPLLEAFGAVGPLTPEQERDRLVGLGFAAPERATAHLRALTGGLSRSAALMRVVLPVMLPWVAAAPDPDGGLLALRTIAEKLSDRPAFLTILRENPVAAERLCTVLGTSPLLGELIAHHPELVDAFADEGRLAAPQPGPELRAEARAAIELHRDDGGAEDALRRFRRRQFVRVAVRDLVLDGGEGGLRAGDVHAGDVQVGVELTALAEACLGAALALALRPYGDRPPVRLALLGMGKLGGGELNYVSDLDLLACHEPVDGVGADEGAHAAARIVQAVVRGLGAATREGRCYRVDLDLRPEGRDGPLSRTLGSYLAYWDRWAEPWEFQALLKARPVAGDADLAARFCAEAARGVFAKALDAATVAELRKMKARVETERLPRGADPRLHLKLGPGAVADVEWTVQLLQLQHGGGDPELRVPSTRAALARLRAAGVLDAREHDWLLRAYDLCTRLRNVGHLVTGRAMDQLPTDQTVLTRLARAVKLPGERQELMEAHRRATRRARQVVEERFWGGRL
jgi:glutamate-ammonia-ligase adenylyltransferase